MVCCHKESVSYKESTVLGAPWCTEDAHENNRPACYSRFMAVYICRWPNGEFSIVNAKTKSDAIELLDEWGNAEQASLTRMPECMLDFRLDDDGQIELASIGESTHDCIMQALLLGTRQSIRHTEFDETGLEYSAKGHEQIRKAVALERARLMDRPTRGKEAETALGREIQKQTGAASVVIDRIVRATATKRLRSKEGEGKKPN